MYMEGEEESMQGLSILAKIFAFTLDKTESLQCFELSSAMIHLMF